MTFVDTGGWIALYNARDQHHADARGIYIELQRQREPLSTTDYVIDETVTRLRYDVGPSAAIAFFDAFDGAQKLNTVSLVTIDAESFEGAKRLFRQYSYERLSFTDCTSFVVCKKYGISAAFAFDHHFPIMGITLLQ